jgi:hypothetical protein
MKTKWTYAITVVLAVALSAAAGAQGRGRDKPDSGPDRGPDRGKGQKIEKNDKAAKHGQYDRDSHRRIVSEYYSRRSLPPGLAKRDALPPGLAKQLRERGELPPGLQKHLVEVPVPLRSLLPPLPSSAYHRYFVGNDLIVVDPLSNVVVTIFRDVIG